MRAGIVGLRCILLGLSAIAMAPALAMTLLQTGEGAQSDPALMSLRGKQSGATVTSNGRGGQCVYTGRGGYRIDDVGLLAIMAEEDCGGVNNFGTLRVCTLSAQLECSPGGQFSRHYRATEAGLAVDANVIAWRPPPADVPSLLA